MSRLVGRQPTSAQRDRRRTWWVTAVRGSRRPARESGSDTRGRTPGVGGTSYATSVLWTSRSGVTVWRMPRGMGSAFMARMGSEVVMTISPKWSW